jgi:hypothetical protein
VTNPDAALLADEYEQHAEHQQRRHDQANG